MTMNTVILNDAALRAAAADGADAFVDVFFDAIMDSVGGILSEEIIYKLNSDQMTLVVFKFLHEEVMDGGFVQLIYNGLGPFVFFNPFAKAVRAWGIDDLATLINRAGRLFRKYGKEITRECSDEEFMAMFEKYSEFDNLDDEFVENEERWIGCIARYIDEHIDNFATIEEAEGK